MTNEGQGPASRRRAGLWPWIVLVLATGPALYHFQAPETARDAEFPAVDRQTYSPRPPAAYRLAEPGDTIDRVALYATSAAVVVAALGWLLSHRQGHPAGLWPVGLGLALAGGWDAATPWPTFDGWYGWNWRSIGDPSTPPLVRWILIGSAAALLIWTVGGTLSAVRQRRGLDRPALDRSTQGLFLVAALLIAYRLIGRPDVEPVGYWPRWANAWGWLAFGLGLLQALPPWPARSRRSLGTVATVALTLLLIQAGLWVVWYHRPLARLKVIVPGQLYISAMPTKRGLEVAQARHGFKTIINLFNENTPQRSPLLPDELAFVERCGLDYVASPDDPLEANAFLDRTLALTQDPKAWPILVHCHGCMDRTPAWVGIYRFVVQGAGLDRIFREIEAHRGLRPKASVTLLYNRVLQPRAPERYASDPVAAQLQRNAHGTVDPFVAELAAAQERRRRETQLSGPDDPEAQLSRSHDPALRRP